MGLNENPKASIWPKCAATTDKLENIMVKPHEEKFYDKISDYTRYLRPLVEIGVVRSTVNVKDNIDNGGIMCMFLGYEKKLWAVHTIC